MPKLPPFEEWKPPWATKKDSDGKLVDVPAEEQEVDKDKLARHLYNLLTDKEKAQERVTAVTAERDDFKTKLDAKVREHETAEQKAAREREEAAKKQLSSGQAEKLNLKYDVGAEKGLTLAQAKRLVGDTKEELLADADAFKLEFGDRTGEDGTKDGEDSQGPPRRTPASKHTLNPADPDPDETKMPSAPGDSLTKFVNEPWTRN